MHGEGRLLAGPLDEAEADATKKKKRGRERGGRGGGGGGYSKVYRLLSASSLPLGVRRVYWLSFRVTCLDTRVKYIRGHLRLGNNTSGYVSQETCLATQDDLFLH